MSLVFLAIGLVLIVEGLAIALAPSRLEDIIALIARMGQDRRRVLGLTMLAIGLVLAWLTKGAVGL